MLLLALLCVVALHDEGIEQIFHGVRAGLVALLVYVYITHVISDFLTAPLRSQVKKSIHELGGRFKETPLFSLKGKFASFAVFMLITLVVINSFAMLSRPVYWSRSAVSSSVSSSSSRISRIAASGHMAVQLRQRRHVVPSTGRAGWTPIGPNSPAISSTPVGQAATHRPHPLQYSSRISTLPFGIVRSASPQEFLV